MKIFTSILGATLFTSILSPLPAEDTPPSSAMVKNEVNWTTNYESARELAKTQNKPLFLYFTGSDWCGWCMKMEKEILTSKEFVQSVGNKFVFVKIDFPIYESLDKALIKQNEELKEKFEIRGFPTVVILTPEGRQIALLNYKQGGGKSYAEYLLKLLKEQESFNKGMLNLKEQNSQDLQKLYEDASRLGLENEAKSIIQVALQKESSNFFLKEYYRQLINEGKAESAEAKTIKEKLLSMDPKNEAKTHYDVAIIDFEANAENFPTLTADQVILPLKTYLQQFGTQDPENRWRVEMTISQIYQSKDQKDAALLYAKAALSHSPEEMKNNVAQAIVDLQSDVSTIGASESVK